MRRRHKRKRTRLRPKPFIVLFLLANLGAGSLYSQVTRVTTVRVDGAKRFDRERIRTIAERVQDKPCAQIDARAIESAVMELPEVRSASFTRNPFGHGVLTVRYRQPVARLHNQPNILADADGVLYASGEVPENLPTLDLPRGGPPTLLTLAGSWDAQRLVKLAQEGRMLQDVGDVRIQVDDRGVLCLNMGAGRVILGSSEDLDKKLAVLKDRLRVDPDELSKVELLNLTQPESPSVVPLQDSSKE